MSTELNFEAEPFEGYTEFDEFESAEFEFDELEFEESESADPALLEAEAPEGWAGEFGFGRFKRQKPAKAGAGAGKSRGKAGKTGMPFGFGSRFGRFARSGGGARSGTTGGNGGSKGRASGGSGGGSTSKQSADQKQSLPSLFSPCEILNQFEFDKDAVRSLHKSQLVKIATKVIESQNSSNPVRQLKVIGHTDPQGTEAYNVSLGSRRAARVANALRETMERMKPGSSAAVNFAIESRGEKEPVGKDGALNRRVEICLPIPAQPPRLKSGEKSFKVVAKSYITKLNIPVEMGFLPCGARTNQGNLLVLLSRINGTGVNAALSDAKDRGYRLYSSMTFKVQYTQGMILRLDFSPWLDTDVGRECFLGQSGCVDPPRMQWEKPVVKRVAKHAYDFFWMAKGRPNPLAESTGFLSVCMSPRRSVDIWHAVAGHIDCSGPEPKVDVKITGSFFPSHKVFVNGVARETIPQGHFAQLWESDRSDPALIRGPDLRAFQKNLPWAFAGPPAPAAIGHELFMWE